MDRTEIRFPCDTRLWRQLQSLCDEADETTGSVLRDLVRLEVQRRTRAKARKSEAHDEPSEALLVRLRLLVAQALAASCSWQGFQAALKQHGLTLEPRGGGLVLCDLQSGRRLCKGSQAGPGYSELVRRFGAGYPGHGHQWIAQKELSHLRQSP